ncbi:MAG: hypothetical protein K8R34_02770 [Methanosarcinales archaeon]|nr:hypothetical protein [Methanosarcinales archaeon]MCD4810826.1 hypothetical protein [Methanosarcinales archaeon]
MRKTFPGYYRPNNDDFSNIWKNCIFVFDASVLLNIYRYTPATRDGFIDILDKISDRLWIPHQAALEYQKNRLDVINQQLSAYEKIQKSLDSNKDKILNDLKTFSRHPYIIVDQLIENIESAFTEINKELNNKKETHPNLLDEDDLRETITELLQEKVGLALSQEKLKKIYAMGKERYEKNIPPGYNDEKKDGIKKFGDLILWCQIIDFVKSKQKPVILIIDDKKDDWWLKFNGKIISPHPELINEMFSRAGVKFYMYQSSQFMEHAKVYLKSHISKDSIDEVRDIEIFDEKSSETQAKFLNYFVDDMGQTGTHLLRVGETLNLPDGWAITVLEIDIKGVKVWLSLTKDGVEVSNQVVRRGGYFEHVLDADDLNKMQFFTFLVENVFRGVGTNIVKIRNLHAE